MTITLQAVNELIQSLESAGELSIKETKVLALAKAYQQLAAENVALKAAIDATIGWQQSTDVENVESVRMLLDINTPATDRIYAGIKADGVDSGIKTIITMLNHQAPGVIDAINVLSVHSFELREGADK
ncbi:hypothetical protein [Raoultella ornithinolytica]|uniref:hypothetical protein n=1 Tax=Raoultella ornithinolytica TaxID=54291 RepID=UPI0023511286|nr:hypothetical protein [Raoultella ornithinolytica]MCF6686850.1 hypothetical protein [Raoultella ornithinolytica]